MNLIESQLKESASNFAKLVEDKELQLLLQKAVDATVKCIQSGKKVLVAGNGGSAADAQHISGELVSRFYYDRPAMAAIALTTDSSILTAIGNDYGYDQIFERQIEALGQKGDVFIAISTSGNSPNILKALQAAKRLGLTTIGLTGFEGGKMQALCEICLKAPSKSTPRIQECHLALEHILCGAVEMAVHPEKK